LKYVQNRNLMKSAILISCLVFLCMLCSKSEAQQPTTINGRSQSFYLEFGGGGVGISANYEFRFKKNQLDGLGLRAGFGGLHTWLFGDISFTTFPLEINYIFSEDHMVSFELGMSLTYTHVKTDFPWLPSEIEESSENILLGYIPIGIRLLSRGKGFMGRANMGPLLNLSAPNLFDDNSVILMVGVSVGFMF